MLEVKHDIAKQKGHGEAAEECVDITETQQMTVLNGDDFTVYDGHILSF